MSNTSYNILSPELHSIADTARMYFRDQYGVTHFKIEEGIDREINFRPTLTGKMKNHHILAVDVTNANYTDALDSFILDCMKKCLPIKLYIAMPKDERPSDINKILKKAIGRGIGILDVDENVCVELCSPIPLSLAGVRKIELKRFSLKYRQALKDGEQTFLNGDPVKGCSKVYDEIEDLSRKFVKKLISKGYWEVPSDNPLDLENGPWKRIMNTLNESINYKVLARGCPGLSDPKNIIENIIAIISQRNETAHKPKTKYILIRRDRRLRTKFEQAVDIFEELVNASKKLK